MGSTCTNAASARTAALTVVRSCATRERTAGSARSHAPSASSPSPPRQTASATSGEFHTHSNLKSMECHKSKANFCSLRVKACSKSFIAFAFNDFLIYSARQMLMRIQSRNKYEMLFLKVVSSLFTISASWCFMFPCLLNFIYIIFGYHYLS